MRRRTIGIMLALLLSLVPGAAAFAQSDTRCFSETGQCISGNIRAYWERNGGLPVFGYPIAPVQQETVESWTGPVQWFERDRLEDHAAQGQGVLAGRLGVEYLAATSRPWQFRSGSTAPAGCQLARETGYAACGAFLSYWLRNGGLARFGFPVTDEMDETIEGRTYRVQYFERRRMELHPEILPIAGDPVLLGLLARDLRSLSGQQPPKECGAAILGEMRADYASFNTQRALGCPIPGQDYSYVSGASGRFERGQMYYVPLRGGNGVIIVLSYQNSQITYTTYSDTWRSGDPDSYGTPPKGFFAPRRGFGKVWSEHPEVQKALGWAVENERAVTMSYQVYERGALLRVNDENASWHLRDDGFARSQVLAY